MDRVEVSRTLVKSPPELWAELEGDRLSDAVGDVSVSTMEPERKLSWRAADARGTAVLEPSGWGTKVTLTAELDDSVAGGGLWYRRGAELAAADRRRELERGLTGVLDDLGSAHRRPFGRG